MTGHIRVVKPNVREQLLETGLQVLHERGFNATSVQDITEAAGVPKGSFYNHFESEEDLGARGRLALSLPVQNRYKIVSESSVSKSSRGSKDHIRA